MNDLFGNCLRFLSTLTFSQFIKLFWFYFAFELIRVSLVLVILNLVQLKSFGARSRRKHARMRLFAEHPLISILVPGKNEGKHLYPLALSLGEQTYKNFEIIVVDDGSDDDTAVIGHSLEKAGLIDMFLSCRVRGGKASAANFALRFASGKYCICMDADCTYDNDAIEKILLPFFMEDNVGGVGGNVNVRNLRENLLTTLQAIEYRNTVTTGRAVRSYLGIYRIISGAFGAFRTDILRQIYGWDVGPGLDGDLTLKIRKKGLKVRFASDANCLTYAPNTFAKLTRQRLRWNRSLVRFRLRKHKDILCPTQSFRSLCWIAVVENLFYSFILNFKWCIYIGLAFYLHRPLLLEIVVINLLLYIITNCSKFIIYSLYRQRVHTPMSTMLLYVPCLVFYSGVYLKLVATVAYLQEIFMKSSYSDPWNPLKTSACAKQHGI